MSALITCRNIDKTGKADLGIKDGGQRIGPVDALATKPGPFFWLFAMPDEHYSGCVILLLAVDIEGEQETEKQ
jgi:hypothetical protein